MSKKQGILIAWSCYSAVTIARWCNKKKEGIIFCKYSFSGKQGLPVLQVAHYSTLPW